LSHYDRFDYIETWETWGDPLASDGPCPWGGLGNYVLLDENCDWRCPFREACHSLKKKAEESKGGEKSK